MFATQGIGATYIKSGLARQLSPVFVGGGMTDVGAGSSPRPELLESGTQNYASILALGAAITYIDEIGITAIEKRLEELSAYLLTKLAEVSGIKFLPGPYYCDCSDGNGIVSFNVPGVPANELGFILSQHGVLVRAEDHCSASSDLGDSVRVSLNIYNTEAEIDRLADVLLELNA